VAVPDEDGVWSRLAAVNRLAVEAGEATPMAWHLFQGVLSAERHQRLVQTHDQLMTLPGETVVVDADGDTYWREPTAAPRDCWYPLGLDYGDDGHQIKLPARVMLAL